MVPRDDLEKAADVRVKELNDEAKAAKKALHGNNAIPLDEKDSRFFGNPPKGLTGHGYGELNGAKPLTEEWHQR
jgi:hypothetical protein